MTSTLLYDQGPVASRPAAGVRGRIYNPTDESGVLYKDDGALWRKVPLGPYDEEVLADSPTLYWPLNGSSVTVADLSGNGYDGTVGGSLLQSQTPGATPSISPNTFIVQDSQGDRVTRPHTTALYLDNDFTIEFWLRRISDSTGGGNPLWVAQHEDAWLAAKGWMVAIGSDWAGLHFVRGGQGHWPGLSLPGTTSWHQVVFAYTKSTATMVSYVNGAKSNSGSMSWGNTSFSTTPDFEVLYDHRNTGQWINRGFQHLAIYSHALSPHRVSDHYHAAVA